MPDPQLHQRSRKPEHISSDEEDEAVRETPEDGAPLSVRQFSVDATEEVYLGVQGRVGEQVVPAHINVRKDSSQAIDSIRPELADY
jgi:hypothetical protein